MSTISAAPPERVRPVTEHPSLLQLFRMSLRTEKAAVRPLLLGAGVCLVLLVLLFWPNLRHFVYTWSTDENYSHGFLVPLIALYFANEAARRGPVPLRGGVGLGMGLLLLAILGRVATIFVPVGIVGDLSFLLGLAGTCAPIRRHGRVAALRLRPGVPGLHDPAADRPVHRDRLSVAARGEPGRVEPSQRVEHPGAVPRQCHDPSGGHPDVRGRGMQRHATAHRLSRADNGRRLPDHPALVVSAGGGRRGHPDRHDRQRDPRRADRGDHVPRRSPVRPGLLPHDGGNADDGPGPGFARRPLHGAGMGRSAGERAGRVADDRLRQGRTHRPGGQPGRPSCLAWASVAALLVLGLAAQSGAERLVETPRPRIASRSRPRFP